MCRPGDTARRGPRAPAPELLVVEQSSQSEYNTAQRVTEDILAANEPGAVGAAQAVRQAGKAGEIVIVGWDASPTEIKGVRDGTIYVLVVQNPFTMGYDGVDAAVRMFRTGASVESEDTGVTIVTKENIDTLEVQDVLNPSCENPPV